MPRGLLVDFGGVLTTSVLDSFAAFCANETLEPTLVRDVFRAAAASPDNIFAKVEIGALSASDFDVELSGLLSSAAGRQIAADGLKARLFAGTTHDPDMVDVVDAARTAGIRTALVSNSWGGEDYPLEVLEPLFDEMVISGHVGLRKPDPDIYLLAAERIGVPPQDCVFVDDFPSNIAGAEAVGMRGILHRSGAETATLIRELFGLDAT
jgi:putative hydrolase of the HAD superfamily